MSTQLALQPDLAPAIQSDPVIGLLQSITAGPLTPESVGVAERVLAMLERQNALKAEQSYSRAIAAVQAETPVIVAQKIVPDKHGNTKFTYAPYEEIMRQAHPILKRHGFSVTYDTEVGEGRVTVTCTLRHDSGHKESNRFSARIGGGPPGANEAQADGAAKTYAKRHAFCDALNIVIEQDTDARNEGGAITESEAAEIERRVAKLGIAGEKERKWLAWAGGDTYAAIPSTRLAAVTAWLEQKESAQ